MNKLKGSIIIKKRLAIIIFVVILLVIIFNKPQKNRLAEEFLQISHRGASAYELEHSLAAYELALAQGSDYLEIDVQLTKDKKLVILHDEIPRFGDGRHVKDYGLKELQSAYFEQFGISLLTIEEVFNAFPRANFYIETKMNSRALDHTLYATLEKYNVMDSIIIQSFYSSSLKWFRHKNNQIPIIQLLSRTATAHINRIQLMSIKQYADGIGVNNRSFIIGDIAKIHHSQLKVHVYTVDNASRMKQLIVAGVDGIFTNRPDILNMLLKTIE